MEENRYEMVSISDFFSFADLFSEETKKRIRGAINIHGMGGTGIPKINLTSIASLYLSTICNRHIVKTGSRKNKSVMGSTDFFEKLGILHIKEKEKVLDEFGFAYYDYLELSPWKMYKGILSKNDNIKDILERTHFFDYEMGILGVGISSDKAYRDFLHKVHYCSPKEMFHFYTIVDNKRIDEILPGNIYLDDILFKGKLIPLPLLSSAHQAYDISLKLIEGDVIDDYWYKALRVSVAVLLYRLHTTNSLEDGEELFEKAYRDKLVQKKIEKIKKYS